MDDNWLAKNLSSVLTGLNIAATAATAVAASVNTYSAVQLIQEKEHEEGRKFMLKEKAKIAWPKYVPTVLCFAASAGLGIASNGLSLAQLASLGAAAGYVTKNRDQIKKKLEEVAKKLPEPMKEDVMSTIFLDIEHGVTCPEFERTGLGTQKCLDLYSGRRFLSNEKDVLAGNERFIKRWKDGASLCLSDLYDEWRISRTTFGYMWGLRNDPEYDGDVEIVITTRYSKDKEWLYIDLKTPLREDWQTIWGEEVCKCLK